jgi:hypothetical protein
MNFDSLSDFNKYTLALAAASFVYGLEKLFPAVSASAQNWALILLACLLAATIFGILLFAAATAGKHAEQQKDTARLQKIASHIRWMGITHAGLLVAGLVILGALLFQRILHPPAAEAAKCCCPAPGP